MLLRILVHFTAAAVATAAGFKLIFHGGRLCSQSGLKSNKKLLFYRFCQVPLYILSSAPSAFYYIYRQFSTVHPMVLVIMNFSNKVVKKILKICRVNYRRNAEIAYIKVSLKCLQMLPWVTRINLILYTP